MMATLRCDHPDIESFIDAKREPGRLAHVQSVGPGHRRLYGGGQDDAPWDLVFDGTVFRTHQGAGSMERIMRRDLSRYAEPG